MITVIAMGTIITAVVTMVKVIIMVVRIRMTVIIIVIITPILMRIWGRSCERMVLALDGRYSKTRPIRTPIVKPGTSKL